MDIDAIQAELRDFAIARNWGQFHSIKNLVMALSVEAAELTEIYQWLTTEEGQNAHNDALTREKIADEIADIFLYLIQIADHSRIDLENAVVQKIKKNAIKHPPSASLALPARLEQ